MARQVTVLPLPVSPTMPSTSPCCTVRRMSSVGVTVPRAVGIWIRRLRSSSAAWPAVVIACARRG